MNKFHQVIHQKATLLKIYSYKNCRKMFRKPKLKSKFYVSEEPEELELDVANNNPQSSTGGTKFYDEAQAIPQLESEDPTPNACASKHTKITSTSENLEPRQVKSAFTEFKPWLSKVMCECTKTCANCTQDIEDMFYNQKQSGSGSNHVGSKKGRNIRKALMKPFKRNR